MEDINALSDQLTKRRQFGAEYSKPAYQNMVKHDKALGDYVKENLDLGSKFTERIHENLMTFI